MRPGNGALDTGFASHNLQAEVGDIYQFTNCDRQGDLPKWLDVRSSQRNVV